MKGKFVQTQPRKMQMTTMYLRFLHSFGHDIRINNKKATSDDLIALGEKTVTVQLTGEFMERTYDIQN